MKIADLAAGDVVKITRHGTKWTVERRREPEKSLNGYVALRSVKGTYKVVGSQNWDIPIYRRYHDKP